MARRTPSAAVAAAFLLGTWSADAFQPHARVSSMRLSRVQRKGSTLDMVSVFGRDVQVSLLSNEMGCSLPKNQLVGCVAFRTNCTGWPKTLTRWDQEKRRLMRPSRCGRVGRSAAMGLLVCQILFRIMRNAMGYLPKKALLVLFFGLAFRRIFCKMNT